MHQTVTMQYPYLHGFFGAPNFGDELLCRSLLDAFSGDRGALVATRNTAVTRRTAHGLHVCIVSGMFSHLRFFTGLPWRIWHLRRASHLLIGGGGLLQDTFSTVTIMRSAFDAALAVRFGIPFYFIGLEVGSIYHDVSKEHARFLLQNAKSVWCRDPESVVRARISSGNDRADIHEMPDIAHAFLRNWFSLHPRAGNGQSHCVVNVLKSRGSHPLEFVALVCALCKRFYRVTLAAAQPGEELDWIKGFPDPPSNLHVFSSGDWEPTLELLRSADCLIAERFHYIAAGAHCGLRVVPVLNTNKARHLVESMGLTAFSLEGDAYSAAAVIALLDTAIPAHDKTLDHLCAKLQNAVNAISAGADRAATYTPEVRATARRIVITILRTGLRQKAEALLRRLGLKRS